MPAKVRPGVLAPGIAPSAEPSLFELRGVQPNPGPGAGRVQFVLPDDTPASLDPFDLAGRRLWSRDVGTLGAGGHVVAVADGAWTPSGVCLVRLTQAHRVATARFVVVH